MALTPALSAISFTFTKSVAKRLTRKVVFLTLYSLTLRGATQLITIGYTVHHLRCTDWTPFTISMKLYPQQTVNEFYKYIKEVEDHCKPLHRKKANVDQPWMTYELQQLLKKRQDMFKAGKRDEYKS